MPAGLPLTLLCSAWLVLGYGGIGAALRRSFSSGDIFDNRRRLGTWVAIVLLGTVLNALGYISLLSLTGRIPAGEWGTAVWRFGIGDTVGMLVSMPLSRSRDAYRPASGARPSGVSALATRSACWCRCR